ncbi:MAG: IclR family transcriptional regulator [Acidobacteria bacterium]|nr:IclR family transcriptional regulator [Acidobacteriota bacterium]
MTKSVPAVERAFTILEMVAASRKGCTLAEISCNMGLPRSSAHYVLQTLVRRGYLQRNEDTSRYMFTPKLFDLANRSMAGLGLREQAKPLLRGLMERTGLTVHLGVLEHAEVVLVEKIEPPGPAQLATWVGKRIPTHCTGAGKALLAHLPPERLEQAIAHGLIRYNDNTITTIRRLRAELEKVRQAGYALDDEEETLGCRCIGAPVLVEGGDVAAAVSVAGTTDEITPQNLRLLAELVEETAATLARKLAHPTTRTAAG